MEKTKSSVFGRIKAKGLIQGLVIVVLTASVVFGIIVGIRLDHRKAQLLETKAAFVTIVAMDWTAFNDGYFSWNELRRNIQEGQIATAQNQILDIVYLYPFVKSASLEKRSPPKDSQAIENKDGDLRLLFSIKDDYGNSPLEDWTAIVSLNSQDLVDAILPQAGMRITGGDGQDFAYGLKVSFVEPLLLWSDYLIVFLAILAVSFPVHLVSSRTSRFFYETKGLESIIYLFEQTEKEAVSHSRRVAALAVFVGEKMGFRGKRLRNLYIAALLHDIGKIAVSSEILQKTGPLSKDEMAIVQKHPAASAAILLNFQELAALSPIVRSHHERMDGSGYPDGLKGDEIPEESRIIAVVDVFEALIGTRPYRDPVHAAEAFKILQQTPLDQKIVSALVANYEQFASFKAPRWAVPYMPMPA
ncbi:MAG TPA: HD-GYP domain-containing protein [Spirochaetales bacterium]|nr:HD-GYP domain-containing protein [Spirochaetales bacterium]